MRLGRRARRGPGWGRNLPLWNQRTGAVTWSLLAVTFTFLCGLVRAQGPAVGYVYPPGAPAGTTVEVQLGGYDFTPDLQFFVLDERVKLTVIGTAGDDIMLQPPFWFGPKSRVGAMPIPREVSARLELSEDLPPGPIFWQVANANGASPTGIFIVGNGLEVQETRRSDRPQSLDSLPVTINGRIGRIAEVDRYRFVAPRNGPVSIDFMARRLGANFHGAIVVRDSDGRKLADAADTEGLDLGLTVAVEAGETYEVAVNDVDFRGHRSYVYRLSLEAAPTVVAALPAAGERGETQTVEFVGYGVATGSAELESVMREVRFPKDSARSEISYRLETPFGIARPFPLFVSDLSESIESTRVSGDATRLTPTLVRGAAVTGTLSAPDEEDRYTLTAKKGDVWAIELQSRALGSRLDVRLQVVDAEGKELAKSDDTSDSTDAALDFKAPADGEYTIVVSDAILAGGGRDDVYRLSVEARRPDFRLTIDQNVVIPLESVTAETKPTMSVKVQRLGDFQGEVALRVEGLPDGVTTVEDPKIPIDKNDFALPIVLSEIAGSFASHVRVVGMAGVGEASVERIAYAKAAGNLAPRSSERLQTSQALLSYTMKSPVAIRVIGRERQRAVHRGTTYPTPLTITRSNGFEGPVVVRMAARQSRHRQGILGGVLTIPPGEEDVLYPIFMPEWLETDRTSRLNVCAFVEVADPQGNMRSLGAKPKSRITMIMEGALIKVFHKAVDLTVKPGESFEIPVQVARSEKHSAEAAVQLEVGEELAGMIDSEPILVPVERDEATLRVTTTTHPELVGDYELKVTVTTMVDGRWPAVSQTMVPVLFSH